MNKYQKHQYDGKEIAQTYRILERQRLICSSKFYVLPILTRQNAQKNKYTQKGKRDDMFCFYQMQQILF